MVRQWCCNSKQFKVLLTFKAYFDTSWCQNQLAVASSIECTLTLIVFPLQAVEHLMLKKSPGGLVYIGNYKNGRIEPGMEHLVS